MHNKAPWLRNSEKLWGKNPRTDRWATIQWKEHRYGSQMDMESNPGYVTYLCDLSLSVLSIKYKVSKLRVTVRII